jgi:hypothetical protein
MSHHPPTFRERATHHVQAGLMALLLIAIDALVLSAYIGIMHITEMVVVWNGDPTIVGVPLHTLLLYFKVACLFGFLLISVLKFFRNLIWE